MDIIRKIDNLLESLLLDDNEIIKSKCSEFLSQSRNLPLFHGRDDELGFENKIQVRSGPRDTKRPIHDRLNEAFKTVFGIAARTECLFTTGWINVAQLYGTPYRVFPVNGFKFIWSPNVKDFTEFSDKPVNRNDPFYDKIVKECIYPHKL